MYEIVYDSNANGFFSDCQCLEKRKQIKIYFILFSDEWLHLYDSIFHTKHKSKVRSMIMLQNYHYSKVKETALKIQ